MDLPLAGRCFLKLAQKALSGLEFFVLTFGDFDFFGLESLFGESGRFESLSRVSLEFDSGRFESSCRESARLNFGRYEFSLMGPFRLNSGRFAANLRGPSLLNSRRFEGRFLAGLLLDGWSSPEGWLCRFSRAPSRKRMLSEGMFGRSEIANSVFINRSISRIVPF